MGLKSTLLELGFDGIAGLGEGFVVWGIVFVCWLDEASAKEDFVDY